MGGHYRYNPGMPVKRVLAEVAADLLAQGYSYVDVRSVPEFDAGHPAGAYNVPLVHKLPGRPPMPNPEFEAILEKHFPKDAKLVLGCATGGRSLRAAEMLMASGWTEVVEFAGGMEGARDPYGRVVAKGWRESGLPVEARTPGRSWEELKASKPG